MAIHADSCSDSCKNPVLYIFRRHLNTWANYGYTTLGRKALFGKKDLVSEADASKLSIQIWLSHAAPALAAESAMSAIRALSALVTVSPVMPTLAATTVRLSTVAAVQLEPRFDAAEIARLVDSQLDQQRQPVLHHHAPLSVPGEGFTLQQGPVRPVPRGPAPHVLEDLLAVGQHPVLGLQVVGVGVAGHRHAGVSEQFSAHLLLAPGSGMAA